MTNGCRLARSNTAVFTSSSRNPSAICMMVLLAAILLVFTVLLIEFRSFNEPVAIVFGAILAMFGTVAALWLTGTTLNIVSILRRDHWRRHRRQKRNSHARFRADIWRRTVWNWWRRWCAPAIAVCARC